MKFKLFLFLALIFATTAIGQSSRFEGIGFMAPTGFTRSEQGEATIFSHTKGSEMCVISLYKPASGTNDASENFEAFWKKLAGIDVKAELPDISAPKKENGWDVVTGISKGSYFGQPYAVVLLSATANGRTINLLVISNSDTYSETIAKFIDSIVLPATSASNTTQTNSVRIEHGGRGVADINGSYAGCLTWGYNYGSTNVVAKAGSMPTFSISGNSYSIVKGKGGSVSYSNGIISFSGGDFNGFKAVQETLSDGRSTILFRVNRFQTLPRGEGQRIGDQQCYRQR